MKTIRFNILLYLSAIALCLTPTSCLKKGLPELPLWEDAEILNVYVEYRYESPTQQYEGKPVIMYQRLNATPTIDKDNNSIEMSITVPAATSSFPESVRTTVSQDKLWMYADISTAATISPVEGSVALGNLGDLTKPQKYKVTAANGTERIWTISVTSFSN